MRIISILCFIGGLVFFTHGEFPDHQTKVVQTGPGRVLNPINGAQMLPSAKEPEAVKPPVVEPPVVHGDEQMLRILDKLIEQKSTEKKPEVVLKASSH